jgi:hypothetical protein
VKGRQAEDTGHLYILGRTKHRKASGLGEIRRGIKKGCGLDGFLFHLLHSAHETQDRDAIRKSFAKPSAQILLDVPRDCDAMRHIFEHRVNNHLLGTPHLDIALLRRLKPEDILKR